MIVGVTVTISLDKYKADNHCWLNVETDMIWAFVGPVLFILVVCSFAILVFLHFTVCVCVHLHVCVCICVCVLTCDDYSCVIHVSCSNNMACPSVVLRHCVLLGQCSGALPGSHCDSVQRSSSRKDAHSQFSI